MMRTPDLLAKRAAISGERVALVDTGSGAERSYAELDDRASRCAAHLAGEAGIGPRDRVAVLAHNGAELIELLFACHRIGALLVPLNWRLAADELEQVIDDCRPALLAADAPNAGTAAELAARCGIPAGVALRDAPLAGATPYEEALATADPLAAPAARDADDPWYLLYTSGTTGRPKGVVQTAQMALANFVNIGVPIGLTPDDTTLNVLPMFHTGGINLYTMPTLIAGGTAVVTAGFDPGEALDLLERRATAFFGVPAIYQALADHERFASADLSRVRSWASGGAPLPVSLIRRYADAGVVIRQGFGMTETGPTVFLIDAERAVAKAGSVGRPQLLAEARIARPDGGEVADGEPGELLVRGPGVTPGYWQRPDADADAFDADGWLRTGDVARRDDDGDYWIVDRVKDMYISGGENVYPAEVERALDAHAAVAESAVVGVPDQRWGEVGMAVVVPAAGAAVDPDALRAHCRERLAGYKVPARVEVADALPRNAGGKVLKEELRTVRRTAQVRQADIDEFARLSGDDNPIHVDPDQAARSRFGTTVAHGMLLASLVGGALRDAVWWTWRAMSIEFPAPTPAGSEVTVALLPSGEAAGVDVTVSGAAVCQGVAAASAEGLGDALEVPRADPPAAEPWAPLARRRAEVTWTVTDEDLDAYARLAGDDAARDADEVPLPLVAAAFSRLLGKDLPGHGTIYLKQAVVLTGPVPLGEALVASVEVARVRPHKGLVDLATRCRTADGTVVADGRALVLASEVEGLRPEDASEQEARQ